MLYSILVKHHCWTRDAQQVSAASERAVRNYQGSCDCESIDGVAIAQSVRSEIRARARRLLPDAWQRKVAHMEMTTSPGCASSKDRRRRNMQLPAGATRSPHWSEAHRARRH